jgi:hypothetical protein
VAQHAAERARADYHLAIRRLHAAGGSLREIAEALRLSHQRVHQIIDEAAKPTVVASAPTDSAGPPGPCSFCGRSHEECAQLIAGPGVFICDRCVAEATRLSASAPVKGWAEGLLRLEASESEARCSFCGKDARHGVLLVASELSGGARWEGRPGWRSDLRRVPGPVPGDPGRDLIALSRAGGLRW